MVLDIHQIIYNPSLQLLGYNASFPTIIIGSTLLLVAWFSLIIPSVTAPKQRAWILTLACSVIMTIGPILAIVDSYSSVDDILRLDEAALTKHTPFAEQLLTFFATYCAVDLIVGVFYYPQYVNWISGWIHHICYLALCWYLIVERIPMSLIVFMPEEISTFILSFGTVWSRFRNDKLFGAVFLVSRLIYHSWLLWRFLTFQTHKYLFLIVLLVLALHIHWMVLWLRKYAFGYKKPTPNSNDKNSSGSSSSKMNGKNGHNHNTESSTTTTTNESSSAFASTSSNIDSKLLNNTSNEIENSEKDKTA